MVKAEVAKAMKIINECYGDKLFPLTASKLEIWLEMLEKMDSALVMKATKELVATNEFPPTISQIITKVREITPAPFNVDHAYNRFESIYPCCNQIRGSAKGVYMSLMLGLDTERKRKRADYIFDKARNYIHDCSSQMADFIPADEWLQTLKF